MKKQASGQSFLSCEYKLHENLGILIETVTQGSKPPKNLDLYNSDKRALLLKRFLEIMDARGLLKYVNRFGLPGRFLDSQREEWISLESELEATRWFDVDYYLKLSAMLRWFVIVIATIENTDHNQLESWVKEKHTERHYHLFRPLPPPTLTLIMQPQDDSKEFKTGNLLKGT